ncbi:MAG TPA: SIS domain-containing protein [Chloroflexota bacterium]|jgi:glucosamine--fructose-6-phosphate aminotransferase (isomerizing)|nr:SIS domain-containing protein [Chloroflexota bacterium]
MSEPDLARLLAEIGEQPAVIAGLLERQNDPVQALARLIRQRDPRAIVLVARGSSDNAAVYGRYLFEVCNRRLTSLAAPSSLTLYGRGPRLDDTLVIGVSQSGRGEDVVSYVREARQQGAITVGIVNDEHSLLASTAEWLLPCLAGPELSIPATKTVTAEMTLLAMLSQALSEPADQQANLDRLSRGVERALAFRAHATQLAQQLRNTTVAAVIGRGFAFPPALEIALKLKETSYTRAEPFSAADFLHGPVAIVEPNFSTLVLDVGGRSSQAAEEIGEAVSARGGQPVFLRAGDYGVAESYAPIVALVLGQLLAIELALSLGLDPARPRGLRKVTSTR